MGFFSKTKKEDKDNGQDNLNPFQKKDTNNNQNDNNSGNNNQNQNQNTNASNAVNNDGKNFNVRDFYKKQGMFDGINMEEFVAAVRDGDVEKAGNVFAKAMENTASVTLESANKVFNNKLASEKANWMQDSKTSSEKSMAMKALNTALPITEHKAVAPMAQQVLDGFLEQGLATDDAVQKATEYFTEFTKEAGESLGFKVIDKNDTQGFQNSQMSGDNNQNDNEEQNDWEEFLTAGNAPSQESSNGDTE